MYRGVISRDKFGIFCKNTNATPTIRIIDIVFIIKIWGTYGPITRLNVNCVTATSGDRDIVQRIFFPINTLTANMNAR